MTNSRPTTRKQPHREQMNLASALSPDNASVELNVANNGKMLGGITGKGFMPGKSGNPGGRKKKPITEIYEEIAEEDRPRIKKHVREVLFKSERDVSMLKEMADRIEGKSSSDESFSNLAIQIVVENIGN